jgi:hypothetical protein
MTSTPPDPEPERTPGLEPGGGVQPGDTPPDSGSTSGLSHPQPMPGRGPMIWAGVFVAAIAVCIVLLVLAQVVGLIDVLW